MTLLWVLYGLNATVSTVNWLLMKRPIQKSDGLATGWIALIPARNESENLKRLLPELVKQIPTVVFDDDSSDGTGEVAQSFGARVIRSSSPLPQGWTGKNRACYTLCHHALENPDNKWLILLDADTEVSPDLIARLAHMAETDPRLGVITGIPKVFPGRGLEPLFAAWVGWILLASNPFGLVDRTGLGHSQFLNGQIQAWRRSTYEAIAPHEAVKGRIMEDVAMGRLLAKKGVKVWTLNLTQVMTVRMYETWRQAFDGFSKNSFEITNSFLGSALLALFLLFLGWGWVLEPWTLALLTWSGLMVSLSARASKWPVLVMPLVLTIGAATIVRSMIWRKTGKTEWKGRTYSA